MIKYRQTLTAMAIATYPHLEGSQLLLRLASFWDEVKFQLAERPYGQVLTETRLQTEFLDCAHDPAISNNYSRR